MHRAAAAAAVVAQPGSRTRLAKLGVDPAGATSSAFADFIRRETTRWQKVNLKTGARVE